MNVLFSKRLKVVKPKEVADLEAAGWISILRAGSFVDSSGQSCTFSKDDLDAIVENYDPSQEEAPLVIGHPKTDAPAYGWAERIKRVGDFLLAKPYKVAKEFKEAVNDGRYGKISVKLEDLSLKHIGFLGAALPAVSGLGTAKLSAEDKGVTLEFATTDDTVYSLGWKLVSVGRALQRFRDQLIEEKGVEGADKIISQWMIDDLVVPPKYPSEAISFAAAEEDDTPPMERPMNDAEKAQMEALQGQVTTLANQNKELTTTVTTLNAQIEAGNKAAWERERGAFCAELKAKGLLPDSMAATVMRQLDLAKDAGKGEFAAGKNPALDELKVYLLAQKPVVPLGAPPAEGGEPADVTVGDFGPSVNEASMETHKKTLALSQKEGIPYRDALTRVTAK